MQITRPTHPGSHLSDQPVSGHASDIGSSAAHPGLNALAHDLVHTEAGWLHRLDHADSWTATGIAAVADPDGLLGFRADPTWAGAALVLPTASLTIDGIPHATSAADDSDAVAIVGDRHGSVAAAVRQCGAAVALDAHGISGYLHDLLARIVGVASTPEDAPPHQLTVRAWLEALLDAAADPATCDLVATWAGVVAFHPLSQPGSWSGRPATPPAPEALAAATVAVSRRLTWERLRRMAANGDVAVPGLRATDAAWMDWPFFARWILDVHRPVTEVLDDLRLFLPHDVLDLVECTVRAVSWLGFAPPEVP